MNRNRKTNLPRPSQSLIGLGWQIASTLVLFTLGGYGFDVLFDTSPWLVLAGALLGLVGIFALIFRLAADLDREDRRKKETRETASPRRGAEP